MKQTQAVSNKKHAFFYKKRMLTHQSDIHNRVRRHRKQAIIHHCYFHILHFITIIYELAEQFCLTINKLYHFA